MFSEAVSISFAYKMQRPHRTIEGIGERDENATAASSSAVGIGVHVATYRENPDPEELPYYGRDAVLFKVVATANTRKGIEYNCFTVLPSLTGLKQPNRPILLATIISKVYSGMIELIHMFIYMPNSEKFSNRPSFEKFMFYSQYI